MNTIDASEGTLLEKLSLRGYPVQPHDCEELAGNQGIDASHVLQAGKIIESSYNLADMDFTNMPVSLLQLLQSAVQFQTIFVFYQPSLLAVDAARYRVNDGTRTSSGSKNSIVAPQAESAMKNFAMRIMASTGVQNSLPRRGRYSDNFG